jgi:hypothetical protein
VASSSQRRLGARRYDARAVDLPCDRGRYIVAGPTSPRVPSPTRPRRARRVPTCGPAQSPRPSGWPTLRPVSSTKVWAFAVLASLTSAARGGNVVVDQGASGTGPAATGGSTSSLPNPWQVPGPCTYACADAGLCPTPCAADQTPGASPYECCSGGSCETPQEPPPDVTATCPACPTAGLRRPAHSSAASSRARRRANRPPRASST